MAFRKNLAKRLFQISKITAQSLSSRRITSSVNDLLPSTKPENIIPYAGDARISWRFLLRRPLPPAYDAGTCPELRKLPVGDELMEKFRGMDVSKRKIRLDGLRPATAAVEEGEVTVEDARKLLKLAQMEMVKEKLRQTEKECVSYGEFAEICGEFSWNVDEAKETAKMLDQTGNVIVLGNVVFLKPQQLVKAIQSLIPAAINHPNGPAALKELETLEEQKARIDWKANAMVRRELWCGLGYMIIQTAAFMRLTFWELSWDVMEPICFYVTSIYCMAGYAFFLRTSKEPTFESFYQSRFNAKQKQLMKLHGFDVQRYNELRTNCYPDGGRLSGNGDTDRNHKEYD